MSSTLTGLPLLLSSKVKSLSITLFCLFCVLVPPVLSHGGNSDCSEECESMYCPIDDQKKEKIDIDS